MSYESGENAESDKSKQQFTSTVAGAVDYISKLESREEQENALSKYKDRPEIFNAVNEEFGSEFSHLLETQKSEQVEEKKEEVEKKEETPDPARIAKEAAKLLKDEQSEEKLRNDLISKGIRGEENLNRRLTAAKSLISSGFEYQQALAGAMAASSNPAILPSGGRIEKSDDTTGMEEYNAQRASMKLPPVNPEYYKKAKAQGLI